MNSKASFGKSNGTHSYPPSLQEKEMANLKAYLLSRTIGWKDIIAIVAKVHRDKYPDSRYTSETFYKPPIPTKEDIERKQYLKLKEKFDKK